MKAKNIGLLIACIIACQLAGAIGSLFTFSAIPAWYATLNKPFFSPPNWLVGPAWLTLYTLMGIALYLVWAKRKENAKANAAIAVFGVQLALNALWSILFFGLRSPLLGLVEIIALWLAILFTILKFHAVSKKAARLLVPYILWVSFASALNFAIVVLNP